MSYDMIAIIFCCVLALMAHASRKQGWGWLAWVLRVIFGFSFVAELFTTFIQFGTSANRWSALICLVMTVLTGGMLLIQFRKFLSVLFTGANQVISGQVAIAAIKRQSLVDALKADSIFVPESMPHLTGFWIYVTCLGTLLMNVDPSGIKAPAMPIPMPVPLDQLFSYNGLGLVAVSVCGVGIFITRNPKAVLTRLGIVKPTALQVGIALGMVVFTAAHDYVWSLFTHPMEGAIGGKLANYNSGTFTTGNGADPNGAAILALATGLCAGIGEETLIRGALQAVFGIFPAGFLHAVLHGQFAHSPMLILQVGLWSTIMGIVRRYTNTTTTIITHVTWNFLSTFLFAFNPPDL